MTVGVVRIVPESCSETSPQRTQGTKVLLPNGEQLKGVTKITLVAEVNDLWRANIECMARFDNITALGDVYEQRVHLSRWQRFCLRMAGLHR